ncbi:hypothetical protein BDV18DRAFT_161055 [Aspergillus unguis]
MKTSAPNTPTTPTSPFIIWTPSPTESFDMSYPTTPTAPMDFESQLTDFDMPALAPADICAQCAPHHEKHFVIHNDNLAINTCPKDLLCTTNAYPVIMSTTFPKPACDELTIQFGKQAARNVRRRLDNLLNVDLDVHECLVPVTNTRGELNVKLSLMIDFRKPVDLKVDREVSEALFGAFKVPRSAWEIQNAGIEAVLGSMYETDKAIEEGREMDEFERGRSIAWWEHDIVTYYRLRFLREKVSVWGAVQWEN